MMHRNEKGSTLIELIVSMAISSIIMLALTMTVTTFLKNYQKTGDQNILLYEVQNAGHWISRDIATTDLTTLTEPSGFPLTLNIPVDTDDNNDCSVDYLFDGNKLKRQFYDSSHTLIAETLIADYIDTANTTFSLTDNSTAYELIIRASKGKTAIEMSYYASQRPGD